MIARRAPPRPPARQKAEPPYLPSAFDGKYRLLRLIGRGSAGSVHEGEDLAVGKRVAIKILHADVALKGPGSARFVAEARASAPINHPNVVDIYDFGVDPGGSSYIVMELLQGETLEALLAQRGALPPALACEIMVQILAGLGAAHRFGLVHRNLKPANVVITHPRPESLLVKMLDFGIAKGAFEPKRAAGIAGAPLYMAPERTRTTEVGPQADIYSAGVILYEMLAGEHPFTGDTDEMLKKVIAGRCKPLSAVNPALPRPLTLAVAAAMATDPARRVASVQLLAKQLAPYVSQGMSTSDVPDPRRAPRDFPSLHLGKIAGMPKGEPLADSLLQSPIIPRAPSAPKINLSVGINDVEMWSTAPDAIPQDPALARSLAELSLDTTPDPGAREPIFDTLSGASEPPASAQEKGQQGWPRGMVAAAVGVGAGAVLAWLYRFG